MKVRPTSVVLCLLVLTGSYIAYRKQFQIAAKIWHWRYGYSTKLGDYEIPVPEHWLVQNQSATSMSMMDTLPHNLLRDRKLHSTAVISIDIPPLKHHFTPTEMEFWLSRKRQDLARWSYGGAEDTTHRPRTCGLPGGERTVGYDESRS